MVGEGIAPSADHTGVVQESPLLSFLSRTALQIFSSHRSTVTEHHAGCAILGCHREHVR